MDAPKEQQVRAGCYCRISSDPQDKREGVERQREDTSALCELKGWTVADYYVDNDKSASNGKARREWDRLLADVKAGKVDAIAAWDQDRGWRVMHELEDLRKFLNKLDRPVLLATTGQGDIDLYSPTGVMMSQIKTAVSEHEIAMMKVRQKRAGRQRAEQGRPKWRKAFGYTEDYQPDPTTAPLVAQAYAAVLAGSSITDIARSWNAEGHNGLTGQPWSPSTVSLFLRSPRNAGLRSYDGEIIGQGTWPGLVDETTWRAAQSVLNAPGRAPGRKTVRQHLLTGVLRCGRDGCGHHLSGMRNLDGSIVYRCKKCLGISIRAEHAEPLVYAAVSARLAEPDAVDLLKAEIHDEAEAETLRTERNTLLVRLDEIADAVADGDLTGPQAKRATERVREKLAEVDRRQHDADRLRVLDGIPLGTAAVAGKVGQLSADRFRAVVGILAEFVVQPVGKGHRPADGERFDPERVTVTWR